MVMMRQGYARVTTSLAMAENLVGNSWGAARLWQHFVYSAFMCWCRDRGVARLWAHLAHGLLQSWETDDFSAAGCPAALFVRWNALRDFRGLPTHALTRWCRDREAARLWAHLAHGLLLTWEDHYFWGAGCPDAMMVRWDPFTDFSTFPRIV